MTSSTALIALAVALALALLYPLPVHAATLPRPALRQSESQCTSRLDCGQTRSCVQAGNNMPCRNGAARCVCRIALPTCGDDVICSGAREFCALDATGLSGICMTCEMYAALADADRAMYAEGRNCDDGTEGFETEGLTSTDEPEFTRLPGRTDAPFSSPSPDVSGGPTSSPSPVASDAPLPPVDPETSNGPQETDGPQNTIGPQETDGPQNTGGPKDTDGPEYTDGPEHTNSPEDTDGPDPSDDPSFPATPLASPDVAESPEGAVCIAVHHLAHVPAHHLVYGAARRASVLCDAHDNCATPGHIVVHEGRPMMMATYCTDAKCTRRTAFVNSPKMGVRALKRVKSNSGSLVFTSMAARYETKAEEKVLALLVRSGL